MASPLGLLIGVACTACVALGPVGLLVAPAFLVVFSSISGWNTVSRRSIIQVLAVITLVGLLGVGRAAFSGSTSGSGELLGSKGGTGHVVGMPRAGTNGERVLLHVDRAKSNDGSESIVDRRVLAILPPSSLVNQDDRISVVWTFETLDSLPPDFASFVRSQDAEGVARVWAVTVVHAGSSPLRWFVRARREVSARLESLIPGDAGVLASGIVTGDDSRFSDVARDAFQHTGTSHITAVSGQNVAILLSLIAIMFRPRHRRRMLLVQLLIIALVWSYTLFAGFSPPSVRAAIFATLVVFAARYGRRPDLATILALSTAMMVLVNPGYVHSISFWLSVVSSAALVTCIQVDRKSGVNGGVSAILLPLMAAQLATIPLTIYTFGTWSIGSLIANAAVAPLIGLAFPLTFALAGIAFLIPGLAPFLAWIPGLILQAVVSIVTSVAMTFPVLNLDAFGISVVIAVLVPCVLGILLVSLDSRRWGVRIEARARRQPLSFVMAGAGCLLGVSMAMLGIILR